MFHQHFFRIVGGCIAGALAFGTVGCGATVGSAAVGDAAGAASNNDEETRARDALVGVWEIESSEFDDEGDGASYYEIMRSLGIYTAYLELYDDGTFMLDLWGEAVLQGSWTAESPEGGTFTLTENGEALESGTLTLDGGILVLESDSLFLTFHRSSAEERATYQTSINDEDALANMTEELESQLEASEEEDEVEPMDEIAVETDDLVVLVTGRGTRGANPAYHLTIENNSTGTLVVETDDDWTVNGSPVTANLHEEIEEGDVVDAKLWFHRGESSELEGAELASASGSIVVTDGDGNPVGTYAVSL